MPTLNESTPLSALRHGHWFKLICGASYQHLPTIRNLAIAYGLAGADCIDVAADPAVIHQVMLALEVVSQLRHEAIQRGYHPSPQPWLMVSLNDDEDPHFRKASFVATTCPTDCPRPCERICPAHAIAFPPQPTESWGIIAERCYGCGRCLPVCPLQKITTQDYSPPPTAITSFIEAGVVQALEIHTQVGHHRAFQALWGTLKPSVLGLRVLAVSCPDADGLVSYLKDIFDMMSPLPCPLIWQTDGRSMSGDIGKGTTHAAIQAGQKVLDAQLPGFVQLAGGTNDYTVPKLRELGLLMQKADQNRYLAGAAYGSYARSLLHPLLDAIEADLRSSHLEDHPDVLWSAVALADGLIAPLKRYLENS
jgi:Fe-S-cluster-containing hydrogenase component 2